MKRTQDRWFNCGECDNAYASIFHGHFLSFLVDSRGVPDGHHRAHLWRSRCWGATWLCIHCWAICTDMSLSQVRSILCITQRREDKRAAWRDWHQPEHRVKKQHSLTKDIWSRTAPRNPNSGWISRRPARIWDERLATPSEVQALYCDTCGDWFKGFKAGSFRHIRIRPEREEVEDAWKAGTWDATWECARCIGLAHTARNQRKETAKKSSYY